MKKKLILLLSLFLCLCLTTVMFTGCGANSDDGRGDLIEEEPADDGRGDLIEEEPADDGRGDLIEEEPTDDGRGDLIKEPEINSEDFYGVWEYTDRYEWVHIQGDGTLCFYETDGEMYGPYDYTMDGAYLKINGSELFFTFDELGQLVDEAASVLFPSELPDFEPTEPYFEVNGLKINYTLDQGEVAFENGGASFDVETKDDYTRALVRWDFQSLEETDLGNGIREVRFGGVCYFPELYFAYGGPRTLTNELFLYDYYTGFCLPLNEYFLNDNGVYEFGFDCNGTWVELLVDLENEWHDGVLRNYVAAESYTFTVRMPSDYDGLVMGAIPRLPTYLEEYEAREVFDESMNDYIPMLDLDNRDHYNALFCRVY